MDHNNGRLTDQQRAAVADRLDLIAGYVECLRRSFHGFPDGDWSDCHQDIALGVMRAVWRYGAEAGFPLLLCCMRSAAAGSARRGLRRAGNGKRVSRDVYALSDVVVERRRRGPRPGWPELFRAAGLRARESQTLRLRHWRGLTFRRIGDTLDPPVSSQRAEQIHRRAAEKLRGCLSRRGLGVEDFL